jgi:hypothetical protein
MDCTFNVGRWVLTHIQSGRALDPSFWLSQDQVRAWFKRLLATDIDWTRPAEELEGCGPYAKELRIAVLREGK